MLEKKKKKSIVQYSCILSSLPREPKRHGQAALTPKQNPIKNTITVCSYAYSTVFVDNITEI